ncbi:MAG: thiolase family protein [Planctomycetota bacterium]|jgi:acetyl-CoA C-acetyltransferase
MLKNVYIAGTKRTPWGNFLGSLSGVSAAQLGRTAIKAALEKAKVKPDQVDEVIMGNVLAAGLGQNIARQCSLGAGIAKEVPCTTVNKVCGSSMKAAIVAAQVIQCGDAELVVAGGTESMSNAPYLLPLGRNGYRMGDGKVVDSMVNDGLWDVYNDAHMGTCGDKCAAKYNFTCDDQNNFAVESYNRARQAQADGILAREIVPVEVKSRKATTVVDEDEEPKRFDEGKLRKLRPAFGGDGTVTAGNASTINDGAGAMIVCSEDKAKALNIPLEGRILGYAGAATDPEWFTVAPVQALRNLSEKLNLKLADVDIFEINEAFAVVAMVAMKDLDLPHEKVNVFGGAVSIGHPIGATGARLIGTTLNALHHTGGKIGVAALCIGGGEALAIAIERC